MNTCTQAATPIAHRLVNSTIKIDLIKKYQRVEGNFDCCASAYVSVCKQFDCLWRNECLITEPD